jgi:hypothetical protein
VQVGGRKADLGLVAVTFGDNGRVVDSGSWDFTIRLQKDAFERAMNDGHIYTINLPVKKPGAYQLRVAVRDAASERVGSANQFIEVPNVVKGRLTLSGIVIAGIDPAKASASANAAQTAASVEKKPNEIEAQAHAAIRKLRTGMFMDYSFLIFNAKLDRATERPQLETQVMLFRDGQRVFTGQVHPFEPGQQTDWKRLVAGGRIRTGGELRPGEYVLQVVVTDKLTKDKNRVATQWIDFEIVK